MDVRGSGYAHLSSCSARAGAAADVVEQPSDSALVSSFLRCN